MPPEPIPPPQTNYPPPPPPPPPLPSPTPPPVVVVLPPQGGVRKTLWIALGVAVLILACLGGTFLAQSLSSKDKAPAPAPSATVAGTPQRTPGA